MRKMLCHVLVFAMVFLMLASVLPTYDMKAAGTLTTIDASVTPVIVIDANLVAANGMDFVIIGTPFSVTVSGNIDVTITFAGDDNADTVTVDRTTNTYNGVTTQELYRELYEAGEQLRWSKDESDTEYFVPTCPFLITNKAHVRVSFEKNYVFKAGGNGWYVVKNDDDSYSLENDANVNNRGGYAGIQVDGDASLTIDAANNLEAYGAYQLAGETIPNSTNRYPEDPLNVNPYFSAYYDPDTSTRVDFGNTDPYRYDVPDGVTVNTHSGGAGIGGGVYYTTKTSAQYSYRAGTPGEIIINGGKIKASGGHQAAGIGGGVNSSSTTSKIEINGGTITAIGGRWACGIGDGDSASGNTSVTYYDEKQIIINGGIISAYGGTASAAIGTTDEVGEGHGVSVVLAGGMISARSGEAALGANASVDEKNSVATAAIGAGQGTDMKDNSISVSAAATISAASFSQYAISNCGRNAQTLPSVNIDPDGYMYLARFPDTADGNNVYSDEDLRVFERYNVKADVLGNPMLQCVDDADIYYGFDHEMNRYYLVDKDGKLIDENGISSDEPVFPDEIPSLTYYYDDSSVAATYTVPAKYKAIAITLPDPVNTSVSGAYVLEVPYEDTKTLNVVIQKHTAGTGAGEITIQSADNIHVQAGENGKNELTPNIREDVAAKALTNMNAFVLKEDQPTGNELIKHYNGGFYPSKYGYTIYIPRDTDDFRLTIEYEQQDVQSITIIQDGITRATYSAGLTGTNSLSLDMAGKEKSEIWIKKIDTNGKSVAYITYKVTVIRKPKYVLDISTLSKVYDGKPVDPEIEHLYVAGDGLSTDVGVENLGSIMDGTSLYRTRVVYPGGTSDDSGYKDSIEHHTHDVTTVTYSNLRYSSNGRQNVTVKHTLEPTTIPGEWNIITAVTVNNKTVTATTQIILKNGKVSIAVPATNNTVGRFYLDEADSSSDTSAKLFLVSDSNSNYQYELLSVNLGTPFADYYEESIISNPDQTAISSSVLEARRQDAIDDAVSQLASELEDNHWTVKSAEATYDMGYLDAEYPFTLSIPTKFNVSSSSYWNVNITIQETSTAQVTTYTADQHRTGRMLVTASYEHDVDVSHLLTGSDLNNVQWEYHVATDGTESGVGEDLEGPPKDAGIYHVKATLIADTYEAEGIEEFIIQKREIKITGIKYWRTYLNEDQATSLSSKTWWPLATPRDEEIIFDNVVLDENGVPEAVKIDSLPNTNLHTDIRSAFNYYEGGVALQISYTSTKILVLPVRILEDGVGKNYCFPRSNLSAWYKTEDGTNASEACDWYWFLIPGELAYYADDAVFRKEAEGAWDKFWPDTKQGALRWKTDENGEFVLEEGMMVPADGETRIGYHSPSNTQHRDYIYMHTVNYGEKEARYAVDIEYGALQYTYTYAVWDVNTHTYVSVDGESRWGGNDEVNNKITITNRSNSTIWYSASAVLDNYFGNHCVATLSEIDIQSIAESRDGGTTTLTNVELERTEEGASDASDSTFYLYLSSDGSGIAPLSSPNDGVRSTGTLNITISCTDPGL